MRSQELSGLPRSDMAAMQRSVWHDNDDDDDAVESVHYRGSNSCALHLNASAEVVVDNDPLLWHTS